MKHDDLILSQYVYSSHDDYNPVQDIYAGYDEKFNLIVLLEHTDYDYPEFNCVAYAIVNKDEAYKLAKRLRVSMTELPSIVAESVDDEFYEIVNPDIRDVQDCFKEILECFSDEKCRLRLIRTQGRYGYQCF